MSAVSDSVIEIIGGVEGNGGLTDEGRSDVDGEAEIQLPNVDPDLSIHIFGAVAIVKVTFALIMWLVVFQNGTIIEKAYWRTWFSGFLAVLISWGPVVIFYLL